jgi:hypothetical protein
MYNADDRRDNLFMTSVIPCEEMSDNDFCHDHNVKVTVQTFALGIATESPELARELRVVRGLVVNSPAPFRRNAPFNSGVLQGGLS